MGVGTIIRYAEVRARLEAQNLALALAPPRARLEAQNQGQRVRTALRGASWDSRYRPLSLTLTLFESMSKKVSES